MAAIDFTRHVTKSRFAGNRIGRSGFNVTVWDPNTEPSRGGPMILLAPGFGDEEGYTRKPLAKALAAVGLRAAVVEHTHRAHIANLMHGRQQRSQDVHGAQQLLQNKYSPDNVILVGHSFGGPNVNDSTNHDLRQWRHGNTPLNTTVVHEAAPGLGDKPFTGSINIGHMVSWLEQVATHPEESMSLAAYETAHIPQKILGLPTMIGEMISLHEIHIQEGRRNLQRNGVPVFNVFYRDDLMVPMSEGSLDANSKVFPGPHLASYFQTNVMVNYLTEEVLPHVA